ncbi:Uncharacterized protein HZ326_27515 [Fusarium oxysporum f. sp. albedinis]|nr:Uncharacterized protein HZ326_27515 [Fusarium oxysporum f. sp. albedinis]
MLFLSVLLLLEFSHDLAVPLAIRMSAVDKSQQLLEPGVGRAEISLCVRQLETTSRWSPPDEGRCHVLHLAASI